MRWQAGESGNPRGRPPKGTTLTELLREAAESMTHGGITRKQAVVNKLWEMAEGGDLAAARLVLEYVDGKPVERVEGTLTVARLAPFTAGEAAQAMAELAAWEELEDGKRRRIAG